MNGKQEKEEKNEETPTTALIETQLSGSDVDSTFKPTRRSNQTLLVR